MTAKLDGCELHIHLLITHSPYVHPRRPTGVSLHCHALGEDKRTIILWWTEVIGREGTLPRKWMRMWYDLKSAAKAKEVYRRQAEETWGKLVFARKAGKSYSGMSATYLSYCGSTINKCNSNFANTIISQGQTDRLTDWVSGRRQRICQRASWSQYQVRNWV